MSENERDGKYSLLHLGKFYPPHRGGIETYLRDLAVRQSRMASVEVVVANDSCRGEFSELEGVRVTRLPRVATIASMPICPSLLRAIRNRPADLVHIHTPNPAAAAAFLASGHAGRLVITHHADTLGRKFVRRFSDPFVNRLMERAARIIVTSSGYLYSSRELAPFREKCRIIPLGIEIQSATKEDPESVKELQGRFGDRVVLAVGRLVPYKGFDVLIRAMKHVDAVLLIVGSGPHFPVLTEIIRAENMQAKVIMLGHVDTLGPYLTVASVFVLPSITRAEAFGLVQLEAMAAGVPVINTNLASGVPEVSLHGETGFTVTPSSVDELTEAINLILRDEELRTKLGGAARIRAHAEFSADKMAERTMSLYEEVFLSN